MEYILEVALPLVKTRESDEIMRMSYSTPVKHRLIPAVV